MLSEANNQIMQELPKEVKKKNKEFLPSECRRKNKYFQTIYILFTFSCGKIYRRKDERKNNFMYIFLGIVAWLFICVIAFCCVLINKPRRQGDDDGG